MDGSAKQFFKRQCMDLSRQLDKRIIRQKIDSLGQQLVFDDFDESVEPSGGA